MFRARQYIFLAVAVLGVSFLPACGARESAAQDAPGAPASVHRFSLNTPVHVIVADPRGKAVLDRDLPGLTTNPSYALFSDMNLSQLASLSNGRINQASLDKVKADLAQLQ